MKNSQLKEHLGYWFNRLQIQIHKSVEQGLKKYDVSVSEWTVLVSLYDAQATSVTELAAYIEVNKSAISRLVYQLTQRGYIIVKSGKDRRSELLELSLKAKKILPEIIIETEKSERAFFSVLSSEEQNNLMTMLKHLSNSNK